MVYLEMTPLRVEFLMSVFMRAVICLEIFFGCMDGSYFYRLLLLPLKAFSTHTEEDLLSFLTA
jgi:hypothetical protein